MEASDQGSPERKAKARVEINFKKDQATKFERTEYTKDLSENVDSNFRVITVRANDPDRKVSS